MQKILRRLFRKQQGFTVIEMLIGVAIIGIVGAAIATGIVQAAKGTTSSNDRMTATNNVRTAGDWISQDARMVENSIILDQLGVLMRIQWSDYAPPDGTPPNLYLVDYTLSNGKLLRYFQIYNEPVIIATSNITVAENIAVDAISFTDDKLTITLTSTVGSVSETRTFDISMRNLPW